MAGGTFTIYTANLGFLDPAALVAGTVKCALINSSYSPNAGSSGHTVFSNVSTYEIAANYGYTAGGQSLANPSRSTITGGCKFSSNNLSWTASGGNIAAWRYAVFYYYGTLGGLTNPLIGYIIGDDTPADVPETTPAASPLILNCPSGGWFTVTS